MSNHLASKNNSKLDPFVFTDDDLLECLPSQKGEYATLAQICRTLCNRISHDSSKENDSRRIEQRVRRHLLSLEEMYRGIVLIDEGVKPHLYRKEKDLNFENRQTIRQLSALQDLIGQYLPIEQQRVLENQVSKTNAASWKQFIYVAPATICTAPKCSIDIKTMVYSAIEHQQALAFTYLNGDRAIRQKKLMPWGLMFKGEKTYVVGIETHITSSKPAIYAMHRMSEMSIIPAEPNYPAKPTNKTITEICKHYGLGHYQRKSDPLIHLTLRLFGKTANNIDGTPISDDQIVEEIAEGVRELRATILWGDELEKFIRGLGPNAEVIEPIALRQKLADEYQQLVLRYGKNTSVDEVVAV